MITYKCINTNVSGFKLSNQVFHFDLPLLTLAGLKEREIEQLKDFKLRK